MFAALSKISGRTVRCTTEAEALEEVMNATADNTHHQWDLDMSFSDSHRLPEVELKYPNGLIDFSEEVRGPENSWIVLLHTTCMFEFGV